MSVLTTTIDNVDPLIAYSPSTSWSEGARDTAGDQYFARYSNGGTFTLTTTNGAFAEFTFNGTDVTIFGAKRQNHGLYSITLDNASVGTFNGSTNDPVGIWGPLYTVNGLKQGSHTVRITHAGSGGQFLDVDYITFNTTISTHLSTVDDTDSSFFYPPSFGWSTAVANASQYNASTGHITCQGGGSATYVFQVSDAVQLFGIVGPNMGQYQVDVDGTNQVQYNAQKQYFAANTMLYAGASLGSGQHNLTITNLAGQSGCVSVDYALASPVKLSATSSSSSSGSSKHSNTGAIAGGIVAAIIVVLAIAAALFFFLRRRRRRREDGPTSGQMDFAAKDPFYNDGPVPQTYATPGTGYPPTLYSHGQNLYEHNQGQQYQQYQQQFVDGATYGEPNNRPITQYTTASEIASLPNPHQRTGSTAILTEYTSPTNTHYTHLSVNRTQSTYTSSGSTSSRSRDAGPDSKARYVANERVEEEYDDIPPNYNEIVHR